MPSPKSKKNFGFEPVGGGGSVEIPSVQGRPWVGGSTEGKRWWWGRRRRTPARRRSTGRARTRQMAVLDKKSFAPKKMPLIFPRITVLSSVKKCANRRAIPAPERGRPLQRHRPLYLGWGVASLVALAFPLAEPPPLLEETPRPIWLDTARANEVGGWYPLVSFVQPIGSLGPWGSHLLLPRHIGVERCDGSHTDFQRLKKNMGDEEATILGMWASGRRVVKKNAAKHFPGLFPNLNRSHQSSVENDSKFRL